MNFSIIRNIIGKIAILVAILMGLPLIVSLVYQEGIRNVLAFLIPMVSLAILGILFNIKKAKNQKMQIREGVVIVGLAWLLISLVGAVPFMINQDIPNFFDAFFESASGFTTTGSTTC